MSVYEITYEKCVEKYLGGRKKFGRKETFEADDEKVAFEEAARTWAELNKHGDCSFICLNEIRRTDWRPSE